MKKGRSRRKGHRRKTKPTGTSVTATSPTRREEPEQVRLSAEMQQLLIDPRVRQAVEAVKSGATYAEQVKIDCLAASRERITAWLRGGAQFDELGRILNELPMLVFDPLVLGQIRRLWTFPEDKIEESIAAIKFGDSAGSPPGRRVA